MLPDYRSQVYYSPLLLAGLLRFREESWKYYAQQSISDNFEVFGNIGKHCIECLFYLVNQN